MENDLKLRCIVVLESLKDVVLNNQVAMGSINGLLEALKVPAIEPVSHRAEVVVEKAPGDRREEARDEGEVEQHVAEKLKLAPKVVTKKK